MPNSCYSETDWDFFVWAASLATQAILHDIPDAKQEWAEVLAWDKEPTNAE